ncbi:MAG: GNAT family N-acetyltransferase [Chloroflexota bacterium]
MPYHIRSATPDDLSTILPLFPRLASFELPAHRVATHLWEGDAELLRQWANGQAPGCFVFIAVERGTNDAEHIDDEGGVLGVSMTTLREELLSHEPSAHLEVLVVAQGAEGQGIGRALVAKAEEKARLQGARSMTLHVFAQNRNARHLYHKMGYDEELIRAIKHF